MRVRVADRSTQGIRGMGAGHLLVKAVWLLGEHGSTGEKEYCLPNLPAETSIK
jgi:hypothetical protein